MGEEQIKEYPASNLRSSKNVWHYFCLYLLYSIFYSLLFLFICFFFVFMLWNCALFDTHTQAHRMLDARTCISLVIFETFYMTCYFSYSHMLIFCYCFFPRFRSKESRKKWNKKKRNKTFIRKEMWQKKCFSTHLHMYERHAQTKKSNEKFEIFPTSFSGTQN